MGDTNLAKGRGASLFKKTYARRQFSCIMPTFLSNYKAMLCACLLPHLEADESSGGQTCHP
jgi:hypothetical protein